MSQARSSPGGCSPGCSGATSPSTRSLKAGQGHPGIVGRGTHGHLIRVNAEVYVDMMRDVVKLLMEQVAGGWGSFQKTAPNRLLWEGGVASEQHGLEHPGQLRVRDMCKDHQQIIPQHWHP